jgi:hypothetical protein
MPWDRFVDTLHSAFRRVFEVGFGLQDSMVSAGRRATASSHHTGDRPRFNRRSFCLAMEPSLRLLIGQIMLQRSNSPTRNKSKAVCSFSAAICIN